MLSFVEKAQAAVDSTTFGNAVQPLFTHIINPIVTLLFVIGVVVFAYGIFEMISKGGDPDVRAQGRNHMLGGIIGMFIMLSAWGILYMISNTLKSI